MINLNITPEQLKAIKIAFGEIQNSGDWVNYYSEEEAENVYETAEFFLNGKF